jgi:hypothetical protein
MRLEGLDPTNSNALSRAIVVHGAWYVNEEVIGHSGMLGRSQGCFAVADSSLPEIMARLGPRPPDLRGRGAENSGGILRRMI